MKLLKKVWKWYCDMSKSFVLGLSAFNEHNPPNVFEWCFVSFLFNVALIAMVCATCCVVIGIAMALWRMPMVASCIIAAIILLGVVLPLLVRKMSK